MTNEQAEAAASYMRAEGGAMSDGMMTRLLHRGGDDTANQCDCCTGELCHEGLPDKDDCSSFVPRFKARAEKVEAELDELRELLGRLVMFCLQRSWVDARRLAQEIPIRFPTDCTPRAELKEKP